MTTEARSLEQCVADARAILDGATAGPWFLDHWSAEVSYEAGGHNGDWPVAQILKTKMDDPNSWVPNARLITLSRNTYSSLLDLVEALDAYVNLIGGRLPRKVERALTDVHESLQENLPR